MIRCRSYTNPAEQRQMYALPSSATVVSAPIFTRDIDYESCTCLQYTQSFHSFHIAFSGITHTIRWSKSVRCASLWISRPTADRYCVWPARCVLLDEPTAYEVRRDRRTRRMLPLLNVPPCIRPSPSVHSCSSRSASFCSGRHS